MAERVIPDYTELDHWLRDGKTPKQISDIYAERGLTVPPGTISVARYRRGHPAQLVDHRELIPWRIRPEHRAAYDPRMLRFESLTRHGKPVREHEAKLLESWKRQLADDDAVVHYEPDTTRGFFHVPRRHGIDTDLIRVPDEEADLR